MSSNLIRRIAAIVVAVVIPLGATASSAHAASWSHHSQARVVTYSLDRSSWS